MTGTTTTTKRRLLSTALALSLLTLNTVHAGLSCSSPSGSYKVGDSVGLELSGNSWWPRLQDVYSITANVYCWSGSGTVASLSISNGDSWTIPESALGKCSGDKMYVQFTGKMWDPPTSTTTTSYSPIYTTTYTLVPTVISGTSTVISITTVVVVTPTALPPVLTPSPGAPTDGAIAPDSSQLPGLPPPPPGTGNNASSKSGSNTNVPAAALGAVGGVAALALIVFGFVMTRKRRRIRKEQEEASAGLGSKDDYYYDGASSFGPGPSATGLAVGGAVGAGAAYGAAGAGGRHSADEMSMPSLHHAYPPVHPPADGSEWDYDTAAAAASNPALFPVPASTSDALKQQYDLANRLSVVSHDDSLLGFPLPTKSSPPLQAQSAGPASATTAYALNQQMSLKQELDNEDDAAFTTPSGGGGGGGGESPELYYLPVTSSPATTPSQAFLSARGSPGGATNTDVGATTTRSSAYET
ncbi:hypothetical protein BGZ97_009442, partial [Linnemannia gamsii]